MNQDQLPDGVADGGGGSGLSEGSGTNGVRDDPSSISSTEASSLFARRRSTRNEKLTETKKSLAHLLKTQFFSNTSGSCRMQDFMQNFNSFKAANKEHFDNFEEAIFKGATQPKPESAEAQTRKQLAKETREKFDALPIVDRINEVVGKLERACNEYYQGKASKAPAYKSEWKVVARSMAKAIKLLPKVEDVDTFKRINMNGDLAGLYLILVNLYRKSRINFVNHATNWLRNYASHWASNDPQLHKQVSDIGTVLFEHRKNAFVGIIGPKNRIELEKTNPSWQAAVRGAMARAEEAIFLVAYANYPRDNHNPNYEPRLASIFGGWFFGLKNEAKTRSVESVFGKWLLDDHLTSDLTLKERNEQEVVQNPQEANPQAPAPVAPLDRVQIDMDHCTLKYRGPSRIESGRVLFTEPPIAFKSVRNTACGYCYRERNRATEQVKCPVCKSVWFCSSACLTAGQSGRHGEKMCQHWHKQHRLGKNSQLILQMVTWCGGWVDFCKILHPNLDRIRSLEEILADSIQTDGSAMAIKSWQVMAVALCLTTYESKLNNPGARVQIGLLLEAYHLMRIINVMNPLPFDNRKALFLVYQLLRFLKYSPQAKTKITKLDTIRGVNQRQPVELGFMLSALGSLCRMSCTANIERQFNVHTGEVEYITTKRIRPGATLNLEWGIKIARGVDKLAPNYLRWRRAEIKKRFDRVCGCALCKGKVTRAPQQVQGQNWGQNQAREQSVRRVSPAQSSRQQVQRFTPQPKRQQPRPLPESPFPNHYFVGYLKRAGTNTNVHSPDWYGNEQVYIRFDAHGNMFEKKFPYPESNPKRHYWHYCGIKKKEPGSRFEYVYRLMNGLVGQPTVYDGYIGQNNMFLTGQDYSPNDPKPM